MVTVGTLKRKDIDSLRVEFDAESGRYRLVSPAVDTAPAVGDFDVGGLLVKDVSGQLWQLRSLPRPVIQFVRGQGGSPYLYVAAQIKSRRSLLILEEPLELAKAPVCREGSV